MFSKKNGQELKKRLDQLERERVISMRLDEIGRDLARAAQMSDEKIEEAVSSPFLYARIRARIAAGREAIDTGAGSSWWAMLLTAWRPLTGMAMMTIMTAVLFWITAITAKTTTGAALSGNEMIVTNESSFERIIFTGEDAPSNDEVLTTIMNQDETDVQR